MNFPIWHGVLHDFNSLKILKKSFPDKKLIFATKDIAAKKFLVKLGFTFSIIKDEKYLEKISQKEENLLKINTNIYEYSRYEVDKFVKKVKNKFTKKEETPQNISFPFILVGWIFTASIFLLFFIFYFAVHKTYIIITPEVEVLQIQKNFSYNNSEELSLDKNTIKLKEISIETSLKESFSSTSIQYETEKQSKWEVILYNELPKSITLIASTRLVSEEWLIFRIQKKLDIKAATLWDDGKIIPSQTPTYVLADSYDTQNQFIGSRGNVEGIKVSIPGLQWEFKNKIHWITQKLSWGSDDYKLIIWEDDIEKASKLLEIKLKNESLKKLQKRIQVQNSENNENYDILLTPNAIQYSDFVYNNSEWVKAGDEKRSFILDGSIKIQAFLYNKDFVLSNLKSLVNKKIIEWSQELVHIDDSSLNIAHTIYDRKNQNGVQVKSTMEIEAYVNRNFDEDGYYAELLKNKILWLDTKEAYDILLNTKDINKVEIKNSPFFMQKVSGKIDNIFFRRKD